MDRMGNILERITLRNLGRFIMEDRTTFDRETGEARSEEQVKLLMEDELRLALQHGWKNPEERLRKLAELNWENGEMIGFMKGMRAGARVMLALIGEGEIQV